MSLNLSSLSVETMSHLCWKLSEEDIISLWACRDKRLQRALLRPHVIDHWAPFGYGEIKDSWHLEHRWFLKELRHLKVARIRVPNVMGEFIPFFKNLSAESLEELKICVVSESYTYITLPDHLTSTYGTIRKLEAGTAGLTTAKTASLDAVSAMWAKKGKEMPKTSTFAARVPLALGLTFQEVPFVHLKSFVMEAALPTFEGSMAQDFVGRSSTTGVQELKDYWVKWMAHLPRTLERLILRQCFGVEMALQAAAENLPPSMTDLRLNSCRYSTWIQSRGLSDTTWGQLAAFVVRVANSTEIAHLSRFAASLPALRVLELPIPLLPPSQFSKPSVSKSILIGPNVKELTLHINAHHMPRLVLPFTLEHLTLVVSGVVHPEVFGQKTLPLSPQSIPLALFSNAETIATAAAELPKSPFGASPFSKPATTSFSSPSSSTSEGKPKFSFVKVAQNSSAAPSTAPFVPGAATNQTSEVSTTPAPLKFSFAPTAKSISVNAQPLKRLPNLQSITLLTQPHMEVETYSDQILNEFYNNILPESLTALTIGPGFWSQTTSTKFLSHLPLLSSLSLVGFKDLNFDLYTLPHTLEDLEISKLQKSPEDIVSEIRLPKLRTLVLGQISNTIWSPEQVHQLLQACPLVHLTLKQKTVICFPTSILPGAQLPRVPALDNDDGRPYILPDRMGEAVYMPLRPASTEHGVPPFSTLTMLTFQQAVDHYFHHRVSALIHYEPRASGQQHGIVAFGLPLTLETIDFSDGPQKESDDPSSYEDESIPGASMAYLSRRYATKSHEHKRFGSHLSWAPSSPFSKFITVHDGFWWNGKRNGASSVGTRDPQNLNPATTNFGRLVPLDNKLIWTNNTPPLVMAEVAGLPNLKSLRLDKQRFMECTPAELTYLPKTLVHLSVTSLFTKLIDSKVLPPTLETLASPPGQYVWMPNAQFKFDPSNPLPRLTTLYVGCLLPCFATNVSQQVLDETWFPPSITYLGFYSSGAVFDTLSVASMKLPNLEHCSAFVMGREPWRGKNLVVPEIPRLNLLRTLCISSIHNQHTHQATRRLGLTLQQGCPALTSLSVSAGPQAMSFNAPPLETLDPSLDSHPAFSIQHFPRYTLYQPNGGSTMPFGSLTFSNASILFMKDFDTLDGSLPSVDLELATAAGDRVASDGADHDAGASLDVDEAQVVKSSERLVPTFVSIQPHYRLYTYVGADLERLRARPIPSEIEAPPGTFGAMSVFGSGGGRFGFA